MSETRRRVLLSGGVGGARLCDGFYREFGGDGLSIVVNTGDDFEHLGLHISPDIDSVLYALAGISDAERGWGVEQESWTVLKRLEELGAPTWFQLGDRDLATHLLRTQLLRAGATLSEAVQELRRRMDISAGVFPVSDAPVRTVLRTDAGVLEFQDYFVRRQCRPTVLGLEFSGAAQASPVQPVLDALAAGDLAQTVLCPSNPFVSVAPMLAIPGLRAALSASSAPLIAVSPIVGGRALKGPAAAMLAGLGYPVSAAGVVRYYADTVPGLLDIFVVDSTDAALVSQIERYVPRCVVTDTVMRTGDDRRRLARWLANLSGEL